MPVNDHLVSGDFKNPALFTKYRCPQCTHILKNTVQLINCGHWLCKSCAEFLDSDSLTKCPTLGCHAHGDLRYSPDWCARKDIEKLEVTCPRREKGCTWEGKLSNLGSHQKDVCELQNPSNCGETIIHDEIDTPLADCTKMMEMKNQKHIQENALSGQHDCHGEYIKFNALFNESAETRSAINFDEDLPNPQPASTNHSFRHAKTALSVVFESDIRMARVTQSISTSKLEQICIKRDILRDQVVSLQESQSETVEQNYQRLRSESGNYDGTILWKIKNFKMKLAHAQSGKYTSIFSLPFYSGQYGYKMCLKLYFMGDGIGKNTHMSLFLVIMKGEFDSILKWPFTSKVTFKLINQTGNRDIIDTFQPDPMSSSFQKPESDMNIVSGCPQFVTHSELNQDGFIVTDTVFIKCIVDKCA